MNYKFQHTAARRRLDAFRASIGHYIKVSTHSRPKAAGNLAMQDTLVFDVSTHSRPKAAGDQQVYREFNGKFQHTAARRRLVMYILLGLHHEDVSTHSRPKAAGDSIRFSCLNDTVSTHSRPKAAGVACNRLGLASLVSTHSRPKAAGGF